MSFVRASFLQRRLTKLYSDTKSSYENITKGSSKGNDDPVLLSIQRDFRTQKDRLLAWGLDWSDSSAAQPQDIDVSLNQAGFSEVVAGVMSTIQDLLNEAERLQDPSEIPSSKAADAGMKVSGNFPSDLKRVESHWTSVEIKRSKELVQELKTAIDTLYELSRCRSASRSSQVDGHARKKSAADSVKSFKSIVENYDPKTGGSKHPLETRNPSFVRSTETVKSLTPSLTGSTTTFVYKKHLYPDKKAPSVSYSLSRRSSIGTLITISSFRSTPILSSPPLQDASEEDIKAAKNWNEKSFSTHSLYIDRNALDLSYADKAASNPPPYEAVVGSSEARQIGTLPLKAAGIWKYYAGRRFEIEKSVPVLVEYVPMTSGFKSTGLLLPQDRLAEIARALQRVYQQRRSSSHLALLGFLGYFVDIAYSRYAFVYVLPADIPIKWSGLRSGVPVGREEFEPKALEFLFNLSSTTSGNSTAGFGTPGLEERFELAYRLVVAILHLKGESLVHGQINNKNVFFLPISQYSSDCTVTSPLTSFPYNIKHPYLASFSQFSETGMRPPPEELSSRIYRHPNDQRNLRDPAAWTFDLYSLGLVLLEIALWIPIEKLWKPKYDNASFKSRIQHIYLHKVPSKCGALYTDVVKFCLEAPDLYYPPATNENLPISDDLRLRALYQGVLAKDEASIPTSYVLQVADKLHRCCALSEGFQASDAELEMFRPDRKRSWMTYKPDPIPEEKVLKLAPSISEQNEGDELSRHDDAVGETAVDQGPVGEDYGALKVEFELQKMRIASLEKQLSKSLTSTDSLKLPPHPKAVEAVDDYPIHETKVQALESARDEWKSKYEELAAKYAKIQKELHEFQVELVEPSFPRELSGRYDRRDSAYKSQEATSRRPSLMPKDEQPYEPYGKKTVRTRLVDEMPSVKPPTKVDPQGDIFQNPHNIETMNAREEEWSRFPDPFQMASEILPQSKRQEVSKPYLDSRKSLEATSSSTRPSRKAAELAPTRDRRLLHSKVSNSIGNDTLWERQHNTIPTKPVFTDTNSKKDALVSQSSPSEVLSRSDTAVGLALGSTQESSPANTVLETSPADHPSKEGKSKEEGDKPGLTGFEALVNSGQTVQCTPTPQNIHDTEQRPSAGSSSKQTSTPGLDTKPKPKSLKKWTHLDIPQANLDSWNKALMPRLNVLLQKALRESPESCSASLMMVGDSAWSAKPTICVTCSSVGKVRAVLKRYFQYNSEEWGLVVIKGDIRRSKQPRRRRRRVRKSSKEHDPNPFYQKRPLCGASIGAFRDNEHLPPVSYGGAILVDGVPFGMTVHHMLDAPSDDESDFGDDYEPTRSAGPWSDHFDYSAEGFKYCPFDEVPPEVLYPHEICDNEDEDDAISETDSVDLDEDDQYYGDYLSDEEPFEDGEDAASVGDTCGIEPGEEDQLIVTQPAIDDVDDEYFLDVEVKDEEHLTSHSLGYVHASSGVRRWTRNGIKHEVDWALIRIDDERLETQNAIPHSPPPAKSGKQRQGKAEIRRSSSSAPPSNAHLDHVAKLEDLRGLQVHCCGRTSGFQRGRVSNAMTLVKMHGRRSFSSSWCVDGNFGVPGDSGAWVFNKANGLVCGHVLAYCAKTMTAYIAPMQILFEDIARTLGANAVTLPSENESSSHNTTEVTKTRKQDTVRAKGKQPDISLPERLSTELSRLNLRRDDDFVVRSKDVREEFLMERRGLELGSQMA